MNAEDSNIKNNCVVVLGSRGLCGTAIVNSLIHSGYRVMAPKRTEFDSTNGKLFLSEVLLSTLMESPIIDAGNYWGIGDPNQAKNIETTIPYKLAKRLVDRDPELPFVKLSSGAVNQINKSLDSSEFELDLTNSYARYKLQEELDTRTGFSNYKIFRLYFPYGILSRPHNLIPKIIKNISNRYPIEINSGQIQKVSIIDSSDLGKIICNDLNKKWVGMNNLAGSEIISINEIAILIGVILNKTPNFQFKSKDDKNITSDQFDIREYLSIKSSDTLVKMCDLFS